MADFDFDELDRAVNNALVPESQEAKEQIAQNDTPANTTAAVDAPTVQSAAPTPTVAPAARRSSGRFMDVVHPSSDMRPGSSGGVDTTASTPKPTPVRPQPEFQASAPTADPFALIEDDWQKPLESPFLTDAKVEKRPLGGEAPTATEIDPIELLEAPDDPRLEAENMPDPIDFAEQLESQDTPKQEANQPTDETEAAIDIEAVIVDEPAQDQSGSEVEADDSAFAYGAGSFQPNTKDDTPAGPTSINQQYQEQPSSSPQSGAIYDTEAYHQPLTPTPKKKSGSFAILWILLILVLGGGAGAAFYFYVLPLL